jgi:hypothetical protein
MAIIADAPDVAEGADRIGQQAEGQQASEREMQDTPEHHGYHTI